MYYTNVGVLCLVLQTINQRSCTITEKAPTHLYTLARICCNSKAECKDYTLGPIDINIEELQLSIMLPRGCTGM